MRWWLILCLLAGPVLAADEPVWFDAGRPSAQAQQAVELLADAASHGLDPRDYDSAALQQALARAQPGLSADAAARLEQALTLAMQRYLGDLHDGRIDPRSIHHDFNASQAPALRCGAAAAQPAAPPAAVRAAVPQLPLYEQLREALARYRALADDPAWRQTLPPLPRRQPRRRQARTGAGLRPACRCWPTGWWRWATCPRRTRCAAALRRRAGRCRQGFQQRHGLAADGVIGAATLAQLQVAPAARRAPDRTDARAPALDAAAAGPAHGRHQHPRVRAAGLRGARRAHPRAARDEGHRRQGLRHAHAAVRRGHALHRVQSLLERAAVDRARRDGAAAAARPGLLRAQGFEFVDRRRPCADARCRRARWTPCWPGSCASASGRGRTNALGDIKFVFPNRDNIYLHHTPATQLFERDAARLQPRLHPRRAAGGAGDLRAAGHAGSGPRRASARR